jgi:hypothetical protein
MLPLFAASTLLTYRIACSAWSRSEAAWATIIGTLVPGFFLCSLEFRTDDLWTVCWLACIAILAGNAPANSRAVWSGLMLGLAAAISAKTSLLAVCLIGAAIATRILMRDRSRIAVRALLFIAAALIPPALIAAYFALHGACQPFLYCTTLHNLVASEHPRRMLLLPVALAIMIAVVRRILRQTAPEEIRKRRLFLFLVASSYAAALSSLWPILESEHWLPFYPLAAAAMVPLLLRQQRAAVAFASAELLVIVLLGTPWRDNVSPSTELIAQTMRLTAPTECVVDLKGEMLFRRRATYPVFEKITKRAISRGTLPDTVAADVLRTRTMVVIADNDGLPAAGRAFLLRNFIPIDRLRVAGLIVPPAGSFRIEVPGEYAVVSESGNFRGRLDDVEYSAPRFLGAGVHSLMPDAPNGRHAIIWQRAAALGFSPWQTRAVAGRPATALAMISAARPPSR